MDSTGGRIDSRPLTAEEETLRRNTDCVYFLASPLTCKKGNECEYRHSEGARVNPRDCWYWLNGNCLNPKCLFRHPPLDGLFGTPGTTSGPAQPPSQTIAPTQIPVAHAPVYSLNKQSVPCIYFQKGHCLKGDKCPFMHGPQPTGNPVSQQVAKVSPSLSKQPQTLNSWSIKQCASQQNIHTQQNIPKASVDKPVVTSPSSAKPVSRTESPPNDLSHKSSLLFYPLVHKFPGSQPAHAPVSNGNAPSRHHGHQVHSLDEYVQIGRKADEFLGESSPGFDVLVDDNIKGNGYFVNEDDLRSDSVRGGKHPDPINDYDHRHSDYKPVPKYERAQYNGNGEFERHGRIHNFYDLKPSRASSERILDRPLLPERRTLPRHKSPDEVDRSDLRHQLLKQRRIDGSRSAISPDHCGESYRRDERYTEDRSRGRHSQRDQLQFPLESSMSTRLRGRITLPRRSSPDASPCLQSEEMDRARHQGLSPARPISNQGRHHERIRRRPSEEPHFAADARNFGGQPVRRDDVDSLNFAGPKSLSELKGAKSVGRSREQQTKSVTATIPQEQNNVMSGKVITASIPREQNNAMSGKVTGFQEFDASLSFEGPKPLSVILKRKREETPGNDAISSVANEHNQRDRDNTVGSSVSAAVAEVQSICVVDSSKEDIHTVSSLEAPQARTGEEEEEGLISSGAEELIYGAQSSAKGDVLGTEDMDIDCIEDRELQNSDHRDGEFDYEAIEAGDFKTEDESTYQEDEEELDDEDEFARKVGIFFT